MISLVNPIWQCKQDILINNVYPVKNLTECMSKDWNFLYIYMYMEIHMHIIMFILIDLYCTFAQKQGSLKSTYFLNHLMIIELA